MDIQFIILADIFEVLTSVYAIVAYVILLFGIMIALVFSLIAKDSSAPVTVHVDGAMQGGIVVDADGVAGGGGKAAPAKTTIEQPEQEKQTGRRFYKLSHLDDINAKEREIDFNNKITLSGLCEDFRNFAASNLGLYYDISDIRKFIAGLLVSKVMILQGISGTGKTSLAFAFGEFLSNPSSVVSVQPMWKERTDLLGYYNEFTKKFNETLLLEKMYEANYSKEIFVTILDEMNIARIEYYFAEFLSLLEIPSEEGRYLEVVSDVWEEDPVRLKEGRIKLPNNMWFIGTANNDDSTFSISDKVYDRAMVLNLDHKAEPFYAKSTPELKLSYKHFMDLKEEALAEYALTSRNQSRLEELSDLIFRHFRIGFGNRIRKQISTFVPLYMACGGEELDALDDIISKKVMRKLEAQNTIYLKNSSEPFIKELDELFGEDSLTACRAYLKALLARN